MTGLAVLALCLGPSGPAGASSTPSPSAGSAGSATQPVEPQTSSDGVEVRTYGVGQVRPYQSSEYPLVTVAVHGVQRVDGGTVVYWSAGTSPDLAGEFDPAGLEEQAAFQIGAPYLSGNSLGAVRLVDHAGATAYSMVPDPETSGVLVSPFTSFQQSFPEERGQMGVLFSVLPELPATTELVDVSLMFGVTVPDVPVEDGYLEPTADRTGVIPLGTGWPDVPAAAVRRIDTENSVHPLSSVVEALDDSQVTTEQGDGVTVDLAADVLFAFDSADLTPEAGARLQELGVQISAEASPGALSIIGHTDNQGSDAYNLDLSRRRAESVAAVLGPAVAAVDLTISVDGRGEAEPVADNGSAEGQQANRRVTVGYTREGGQG